MRLFTVHAPQVLRRDEPSRPADIYAGGRPLPARASVPVTGPVTGSPVAPGRVALVPEGFSFWAALLPPLWLLWHRQWLALALFLPVWVMLGMLLPRGIEGWVMLALHLLLGWHAQDIRRWTARRQGLAEIAVVAAPDEDAAMLRLLAERPELARGFAA
ncbi:DUF2628 domain-containing protein [Acetobacteraceae bacterium H6797]|nr:DUF2628 domain-containing protein [Acetobacteraceae bacterium H6797]